MSTIYLVIGFPGSGKSTWSREKAKSNKSTLIINRDSIRTMIKGTYTYDEELEPLVVKMSVSCLNDICDGRDVIIDETNLTKERRKEWLSHCSKFDRKVFVWFPETVKNLDRRMNESRGVSRERWQVIIDDMKKIFEIPALDEGVNDVIIVTDEGESESIGDICKAVGCSGVSKTCPTCDCEIVRKYVKTFGAFAAANT